MPLRAEFTSGEQKFEVFVLDESYSTIHVACRPWGDIGQTRGETVASITCKRKGSSEDWVPSAVFVPERSGIAAEKRGDVQMAMMQFAAEMLHLILVRPDYMTRGDQGGWANWDAYRAASSITLALVTE